MLEVIELLAISSGTGICNIYTSAARQMNHTLPGIIGVSMATISWSTETRLANTQSRMFPAAEAAAF